MKKELLTDMANLSITSMSIRFVPVECLGTPYMARARRHRKRRIDKKWLKRYGYVMKYKDDKAVAANGVLFMTERCYRRLKRQNDIGTKDIKSVL